MQIGEAEAWNSTAGSSASGGECSRSEQHNIPGAETEQCSGSHECVTEAVSGSPGDNPRQVLRGRN